MGIATQIETAVDQYLNNFISSKVSALCSALAPVALTSITIYIILIGFSIMRGDAQDSLHTFVWKSVKISFICGLALSAGEFQGSVIDGLTGVQGAFIQAFGNTTTIGGLIDNMSQPYDTLGAQLWGQAVQGTFPNVALCAAAGMTAVAQAIIFTLGLGLYLLAKVGFALVMCVGPAFVFMSAFPATQKFTESWLGQALNFVVMNVLVGASVVMITSMATQFATAVQANTNGGDAAIIKDTMALLLISGSLAVVLLNLNTLASAIAGGASISGVGRDIGRALMDVMNKGGNNDNDKDKDKNKGGGEISGSGNAGSGNSGGKTSGAPMYQRNVIDNIRKSA